jgi:ComF family protein
MPALRDLVRDAALGAMDLVFAPVCVVCARAVPTTERERIVCRLCWLRCRAVPAPRCPRCGVTAVPTDAPGPTCRGCHGWNPALRVARSAFLLDDVPRGIVHALKYRGWARTAEPMAARMADLPLPDDVQREAVLVVPVPASDVRRRERGYNQAALLAAAFAVRTGRRAAPSLLARQGSARSQTTLHGSERRDNVAGAFAAPAGASAELAGEHVILVDDVWTTGATAGACVDALLEGGARVVSVITFARVIPELER